MDRYAARHFPIAKEEQVFCALLRRNIDGISEQAAHRKWASGYVGNAAGEGFGMGLQIEGGTAWVGALCLQARRWHKGQTAQTVFCLADFNVDAEHRSLGPALALMKAAIAEAETREAAVYGFPNAAARGLVKRAGLIPLGCMQCFGKLLSSRFLGRHHADSHGAEQGFLRRCAARLAPVVDPILWLLDALQTLLRGHGARAYHADFEQPWMDTLWAARDEQLRLSERSAATVAWRYRSDLREGWRVARIDTGKGTPLGYVVWRLNTELAEVGDLFCAQPRAGITAILLAFSPLARREGAMAISLEFLGNAQVAANIRRAGFFSRPTTDEVLGKGISAAEVAVNGYFTGFDRDTH